jgi:glucose/arabinose dehydrogenase
VLDLRGEVTVGAEQGLLGLAFHPDFARNRRLVVDFTDRHGDTRVVEYRLGRDGRADAGGGRTLLAVDQPEENHNGGALLFSADGTLLVGMGDGGGAFDPDSRAQNPRERLGKVLRADIDGPDPVRWTTLLTGLRNPWRIWMDPALNELWIGDVGQDTTEEIDRVRYEPDEPPKNLGWPAWEGDRLLDRRRLADGAQHVRPVAAYGHDEGCSVTGGLIYRGRDLDALRERYVYGDFCSGAVWTLRPRPPLDVAGVRRETVRVPQLTSIGTDAGGELVFATAAGELLRAVRPAPRARASGAR